MNIRSWRGNIRISNFIHIHWELYSYLHLLSSGANTQPLWVHFTEMKLNSGHTHPANHPTSQANQPLCWCGRGRKQRRQERLHPEGTFKVRSTMDLLQSANHSNQTNQQFWSIGACCLVELTICSIKVCSKSHCCSDRPSQNNSWIMPCSFHATWTEYIKISKIISAKPLGIGRQPTNTSNRMENCRGYWLRNNQARQPTANAKERNPEKRVGEKSGLRARFLSLALAVGSAWLLHNQEPPQFSLLFDVFLGCHPKVCLNYLSNFTCSVQVTNVTYWNHSVPHWFFTTASLVKGTEINWEMFTIL